MLSKALRRRLNPSRSQEWLPHPPYSILALMQASTHLSFGGNCSEAFHFYVKTLGCKLEMIMTYGDSPAAAQVEPAFKDKVIHASLNFGRERASLVRMRLPIDFRNRRDFM